MNKFVVGDEVTVKETGERTKIKSISWEGGPYIWLENGDRVGDMSELEKTEVKYPAIYRHFKNKYYATMGIVKPVEGDIIQKLIGKPNVIMFEAEHTETGDIILIVRHKKIFYISNKYVKDTVVLYKSLYDGHIPYIRPLTMFASEVDHEKYPDVKQKYRFEIVRY